MRAILLIAAIVAVTAVVVVDATSTSKLQRRLRSAVAHGAMVEEQVAVSAPHARVRLTNPLQPANQYYGHGGFFGYGAELLDTPAWVKILSDLMPTVAKSVTTKTAVSDIIKALENNPVVCAFGFEQSRLTNPNGGVYTQPFEWDSFFHPQATVEHPMVESMLVAHGTPLQLFQEGFWKSNSYGSVERTPSTELGGVTSVAWRDIFVKAVYTSRNQPIPGGKVTWPVFNALFPGGSYRVILDVKTGIHLATAKFLASVVTEFKKIGITVVGTGSFNYDQITGVVPAGGVAAPASTWFFHGLESRGLPLIAQPQFFDVYDASPNKLQNKNVLFNLGFMLTYSDSILKTGADKQATYTLITRYVTKLRQIAASVPGLKIGGYVQEAAVDAAALNILFKFVKDEAATFKLGFAWGGRADQWYSEPAPTRLAVTTGTDGQIIFAKVPEN